MHTPLICLVFFALWTVGLVLLVLGPIRISKVLRGHAKPNEFPADVPHGDAFYRRVMRAHANCVENLPVFGAVVLTAAVAGYGSSLFSALAVAYVAARVGQTIAHLSSGRSLVINVRFAFFLTQVGCVVTMGGLVLGHLLAP